MSDWLEDAYKRGVGGDAIKTTELVNRTFTILTVKLKDIEEEKDGKVQIRQTYVGTIRFDSEAEEREAWLGGAGVKTQIDDSLERRALPMRVKLVLDGKAYMLVRPAGEVPTATAEPSLKSLMTDWVRDIGGLGEVQRALSTGKLMSPIATALGYSEKGELTWRLNNLDEHQKHDLILALRGEWKGPVEEIPAEPDEIPFE